MARFITGVAVETALMLLTDRPHLGSRFDVRPSRLSQARSIACVSRPPGYSAGIAAPSSKPAEHGRRLRLEGRVAGDRLVHGDVGYEEEDCAFDDIDAAESDAGAVG